MPEAMSAEEREKFEKCAERALAPEGFRAGWLPEHYLALRESVFQELCRTWQACLAAHQEEKQALVAAAIQEAVEWTAKQFQTREDAPLSWDAGFPSLKASALLSLRPDIQAALDKIVADAVRDANEQSRTLAEALDAITADASCLGAERFDVRPHHLVHSDLIVRAFGILAAYRAANPPAPAGQQGAQRCPNCNGTGLHNTPDNFDGRCRVCLGTGCVAENAAKENTHD